MYWEVHCKMVVAWLDQPKNNGFLPPAPFSFSTSMLEHVTTEATTLLDGSLRLKITHSGQESGKTMWFDHQTNDYLLHRRIFLRYKR